jgi:hypothetical protein
MPIGWAIVVVGQWLAIIALAVVVLGILRQVTPRLQATTAHSPARLQAQGPAVGSAMPDFTGRDRYGGIITTAQLRGRPAVVLFLSADCSPCVNLAREMGASDPVEELADALVVVIDPGGVEALELPGWPRVLAMPKIEVLEVLEVRGRPFAMAVDNDWVVREKRMVNTVEQLRSLAVSVISAVS